MRDLKSEINEYLPTIGYRIHPKFQDPNCWVIGEEHVTNEITVETIGPEFNRLEVFVENSQIGEYDYFFIHFDLTEETIEDLKTFLAMPENEIVEHMRALNRL